MTLRLSRLAMVASAAALAGCGLGPGDASDGTATLTVTRDYGATRMIQGSVEDPNETETVMRLLDREAEIETRYGGGFVQSIEGISGTIEGGRNFDWFFYVNGIESPIGSADRPVSGGDRIWWDHRDWTDAMRIPAVVGSWPEPFLQASAENERLPVLVECAGESQPCATTEERLSDAGVDVADSESSFDPGEVLRVLVGTWPAISGDAAAALLEQEPAVSGVFARFESSGPATELMALDVNTAVDQRLGAGAGIVAAVRDGEDPPTWIVSGVDKAGVQAAADALTESVLGDRFAAIVAAGSDVSLAIPVVE